MSSAKKKDRPRGVAIVAVLQIIVGFMAFAVDAYAVDVFSTHFVPGGGAAVLQLIITYGLVIAGVVSLVLGYGIWRGWHWIWLAVVILDALGIVYALGNLIEVILVTGVSSLNNYAFALGFAVPVVAVCSVELWYFSRERTRRYFV